MQKLPTLRDRLLNGEMPEIGERWRSWIGILYAVFGVGFALTVVVGTFFHDSITLGPGMVDEPESVITLAMRHFEPIIAAGHSWFFWVFIPLAVFAMVLNAVIVYRGFTHFERELGEPISLRETATLFALNGILVAMMYAMLLLAGIAAWSFGLHFMDGWQVVRTLTEMSTAIVARVPTLVELPYPLPLFAAIIATDFFYYWFHRLGHTWRPFWLLWHRPHHMMPHLTIPTTQPVFAAVPLFLLIALPFQVIVGVLAKIFGPDTMILEALLFRAVGQIPAVYSHNSAMYYVFQKNRLLKFLGSMHGGGNYHYIHHSALPQHMLCNMAGTIFYFWDRVFGTYFTPTPEKPPVGLTGSPPLHMNPLRLALSGMWQLVYEWRHNRHWRERFWILFGSTNYSPPVTHDFAVKQ